MRARRALSVRLASLGGAVALGVAGLAGSVGLALSASGGPAGADTPTFNTSCTIPPSPTVVATIPVTISGSISPNPVSPGSQFNMSNFGLHSQITAAFGSAIAGGTFSGALTGLAAEQCRPVLG